MLFLLSSALSLSLSLSLSFSFFFSSRSWLIHLSPFLSLRLLTRRLLPMVWLKSLRSPWLKGLRICNHKVPMLRPVLQSFSWLWENVSDRQGPLEYPWNNYAPGYCHNMLFILCFQALAFKFILFGNIRPCQEFWISMNKLTPFVPFLSMRLLRMRILKSARRTCPMGLENCSQKVPILRPDIQSLVIPIGKMFLTTRAQGPRECPGKPSAQG